MVLDGFLSRVTQTPDATAVQDGGLRLTYLELARHASGLAARLARRGVRPDDVVAVYADRSAELVAAELAVLLVGAAYLPLDPAHPAARTSEVLALSGAAAVVSTGPLLSGGAPLGDDPQAVDLTAVPSAPVAAPARPDDAALAYVIFTSGSTGRPKGVAVSHGSLANLMRWREKAYPLGPQDRTTLLCSPGFDVAVWDTWPTLAAGGTLVVPPAHVRTSSSELVAWLADEQITATFLPTPLAELVLDERWPSHTVLRMMHTGGSALQRGVPPGLPFTLVNLYGPAECTVGVTTTPVLPAGPVPPPIGVPIDGVRCYVLDGLDAVPDGEPGEMCLAGACVARGYLGDPAATARSFVPDVTVPGQRMYRTGDKVRRRADGSFEYLGRFDDQVKIRGFRIEPGEVAAVLRQHPAVTQSFVAAERSGLADPSLIGYVAADVTPAELIEFAASRLPSYMVPAAIVVLPALPMTPNGKVDRAALPAPGRAAAGLAEVAAAHRTPTEAAVAGIVSRLLGGVQVGADDDFFALGGTSLLVGRLAVQIATELAATVSLADLLRARTVAAIAAIVDERTGQQTGRQATLAGLMPDSSPAAPARPPVRPGRRDGPIPLSQQQWRVWFFEQLSPGNLAYNFQATVSLHGDVDTGALRAALDEIVRRHEILRTAFVAVDGVPAQQPVTNARAPLRVLDVPAEQAEEVIAAELRKPFDLTRPPLARWLLLRHGGGDNTFVHVEHHFVHDGWSVAVLLSELSTLYQAFATGQPSPLPDLAIQYADYALWQREWMQGDVLRAHVDHWTALLAGAPDILELPADHPRPPVKSFRGAAPRIKVPAELSRALRSFSRENRVSLFSTMYAGFAALLYRYTGQEGLLVGTGVANRSLSELEPLLGMIVNTLVLRTRVRGQMPFTDLLDQVQQTVADTLAWSDTPVDAVIAAIGPARDPSRTPLFQVMFSFHDSAVPDLDFGGLSGAVTERANGSAKFDLNVIVVPRAAQRLGREPRPEDDDLNLIWEYSTDLFDETTMSQMVTHYLNLLTDAVARPATQVGRLRLLADAESRLLDSAFCEAPALAAGTAAIGAPQSAGRVAVPALRSAVAPSTITRRDRSGYRAAALESTDRVAVPAPRSAAAPSIITRRDRSAYRAAVPEPTPDRPAAPAPHLVRLTDDWALWRTVCLRSAGFPAHLLAALGDADLACAADAVITADAAIASVQTDPGLAARNRAGALYAAEFAGAIRRMSAALHSAAGLPLLREAVAWQNRHALTTGIDVLRRRGPEPGKRNSQQRQHEALVASYLQRYCAKNDSIGFFGPVSWSQIDDGPGIRITHAGSGHSLAARVTYLEGWAVGAIMAGHAAALRPWLVPRRMPFVGVDGTLLRLPLAPPVPLTPGEAAVMRACDGTRDAREVAAAALADPGAGIGDVAEAFALMGRLADSHRLAWQVDVAPQDIRPERSTRALLSRVTDDAVRGSAEKALDELVAARDDLAGAAGDAERVAAAMAGLEATFTGLAGVPPTRRAGETYAGRTLAYEECLRGDTVRLGADVLDGLRAPLALVLDSARWFIAACGALYARHFEEAYRQRAAALGTDVVPFADIWLIVNDALADPQELVEPAVSALRQRWSVILDLPPGARRAQFRAADLAERVTTEFPAQPLPWPTAVHHSPDLMIAGAEAVGRGRLTWVLGEVHTSIVSSRYAPWLAFHDDPEAVRAATRHDLHGPAVWFAETGELGGTGAQQANALSSRGDLRLVFAHDSCGYDPAATLPVGDCDVIGSPAGLRVRRRDGTLERPLLEVVGDLISTTTSNRFDLVPPGAYAPRVTIDDLVVSRETWRLPVTDPGFADTADESARYLQARAWAVSHGLPRHVFCRFTGERKPIYADLTSLASIDLISRSLRRARRHAGADATVTVVEMLPTPDQAWLTDAQGLRYTAELRVVAVDQKTADQK